MYQRSELANGMRIVGEIVPYVRSVSIGLWVGTGSRDESSGQEGIAHLIEHMLFKGTEYRSAKQIAEEIDAVGGQMNAFTTKEYTCFYVRILDDAAPLGLEILADMFCRSLFLEEELAKEKSVILEEIKSYEDAPEELVHDLLASAAWPDHPLGHPILGTPTSVSAITRDDLRRHLTIHYRPENVVLAIAGRFEPSLMADLASKHLSGLPGGGGADERVRPRPAGNRLYRGKDIEQTHLCLGCPGVERSNPDKYAVYVLDSILGGSVSSRLFQQLREERGLVYSTSSAHAAFCDTGLFSVYAGTAPDKAQEVIDLITEALGSLSGQAVGQEELERAKQQLRGTFLLNLESTTARMGRLAKGELFYGGARSPEEVLQRIDAVKTADVKRMAEELFARGPFPFAVVAPARHIGDELRLSIEEVNP